MTNIVFLTLIQISALGGKQGTFEQAYQQSVTSGRPLVVLIGAGWCPGCQTMKNSILPQVKEAGGLDRVVFFYVDFDRQRQLAVRLRRATSIPQLIRFDRTTGGWKTKCMVGAKSPHEVYQFINAGLANKTKISKVSTDNLHQGRVRKTSSGNVTRSKAATSPSRSSSTNVSSTQKQKARS
ncbi:MAG: thioredoxin family protein [Pirellulales bacterium]|nr:thioredoxin family protein [Pirellulales bacterium]